MNASYIVDRNPSETFTLLYEGDVIPTDELWTLNGTESATINDNILTKR